LRACGRTTDSSGAGGAARGLSPPPSSARRQGARKRLAISLEAMQGGQQWRSGRSSPTPLEDGPLCGVLVRCNLHYPFVFHKGRRSE